MKPTIFIGSASPDLGKRIAHKAGLVIGKLEVVHFSNSEIKATVSSNVQDKPCLIVQSTSNPTNDHLMELLFIIDALKRQEAQKIEVIMPYFGYARQNIQYRPGECVSMNVVAKMLEELKVNEVTVVDIHDKRSQGTFPIPFHNISALPLLAKQLYLDLGVASQEEEQYLIGSPDQGGIERARNFANHFYLKNKQRDTVVVEKKRDIDRIHLSKTVELFGDVQNKTVILVDDVATSGKTIINACDLCLKFGAKEVYAVVVHADFGLGIPKLIQTSFLKKFYTTNTIEKTLEDLSIYPKIKVINILSIFDSQF